MLNLLKWSKYILFIIFITIVTVIGLGAVFSFLAVSNSLQNESDRVFSKSNGADFVINTNNLKYKDYDHSDLFKNYVNDKVTLDNNPLYGYFSENEVNKVLRIIDYKNYEVSLASDRTNKTVYTYSDILTSPIDGLEQFIDKSATEISVSTNIKEKETNTIHTPSPNEASILAILIEQAIIKGREAKFANEWNDLSATFSFEYSYLPSSLYASVTGGTGEQSDSLSTFGFVRLFPAIQNIKKPYNLHLLQGKYSGEHLAKKYIDLSTYDFSNNNAYNANQVCNSINDYKMMEECHDSLIKQIVISKNFASTNGFKIGDQLNINSIDVTIVGIGEARNVLFPIITKNYPLPIAKYTGVIWGYDTNENDLEIAYENKGSSIVSFLQLNSEETDSYLFAKFKENISPSLYNSKIKALETSLKSLLENSSNEKLIFSYSDDNFPNKLNQVALSNLANAILYIGYAILGLILLIILIFFIWSLNGFANNESKSLPLESRTKKRFAIGVLRLVLLPWCFFIPALILSRFLGLYLAKSIITFINPMLLNELLVSFIPLNSLIIFLSAVGSALFLGSIFSLVILIKNYKLWRKKDNLKLSNIAEKNMEPLTSKYKIKKAFPPLLSFIGKISLMVFIFAINIPILFTLLLTGSSFSNYTTNYSSGKNYESAIFYNQPLWNSPLTRYSIAYTDNDDSVYSSLNIDNVRSKINSDSTTSNLKDLFREILKSTWLKDTYMIFSKVQELDQLNFPQTEILGIDYSYGTIRDLACSTVLGDEWEELDQNNATISSCIMQLLAKRSPEFMLKRLEKNPAYPFSFGRISLNSTKEELFTWANTTLTSWSDAIQQQEFDIPQDSGIIGLSLSQKNVKLLDINKKDLFDMLLDLYFSQPNQTIIPVIINKALARKTNLINGNYFNAQVYRKELTNFETNLPVYGIIKDVNDNTITNSGEALGQDSSFPDGNEYQYYYPDEARGLQEIVLGKNKGVTGLGWSMPEETKKLFLTQKIGIRESFDNYRFKVIGITENFELNKPLIYALRPQINKMLKYGDDWFSGKYSKSIKEPNDIFERNACVINMYGLYTQDSLSQRFANPLTQCMTNAEFIPLAKQTITVIGNKVSATINTFIIIFSIIWALLIISLALALSNGTKKLLVKIEKLKFKKHKLFTLMIPAFCIITAAITTIITLLVATIIANGIAHDMLNQLLFDVPLTIQMWYYGVTGGSFFTLFFFFYLLGFIKIRKKKKEKESQPATQIETKDYLAEKKKKGKKIQQWIIYPWTRLFNRKKKKEKETQPATKIETKDYLAEKKKKGKKIQQWIIYPWTRLFNRKKKKEKESQPATQIETKYYLAEKKKKGKKIQQWIIYPWTRLFNRKKKKEKESQPIETKYYLAEKKKKGKKIQQWIIYPWTRLFNRKKKKEKESQPAF